MTDEELRQRSLINVMSLLTYHLTQGSMTSGDKDLVVDTIIHLTILLNEFKLHHKIEISNADLWEE